MRLLRFNYSPKIVSSNNEVINETFTVQILAPSVTVDDAPTLNLRLAGSSLTFHIL